MKTVAFLAALLLLLAPAGARAANVGFTQVWIPADADKPLTVGVWYPTEATPKAESLNGFTQEVAAGAPAAGRHLALVVFSHGSGGWYGGHYDTALALARAGFVVAAVSHAGDTYDDQSRSVQIWRRTGQIRALVDYILAAWPEHARIDPHRIGIFGFSAGGFTALVAAGGTPDLTQVGPRCRAHPAYFECHVVKESGATNYEVTPPPTSAFVHDPRIKAAVVAAPALGYAFGKQGLKDVRVPIQLWRAEFDHILPAPDYADAVARDLSRPPAEYHVVSNADHYDFLAPCSPALAKAVPDICAERPGFDRSAFHQRFDADIVRFFEKTLR